MKITVGIPSTRAHTLEFAARSICEQTWKDWELLIVGQGSEASAGAGAQVRALQAAGERLERWDPRIKYIHLAEMGVSRARNEVFSRAQGKVIAFIDDDCEADPEWLAVIAGRLQSNPSVGLVGGATVPPPHKRSGLRLRLSTCPTILPSESLYDPDASGRVPPPGWDWGSANVAIRAEVVARVGMFDEHLGPGTPLLSGEDRDYSFRLEAAAVCMMATPQAVVHHTYGRRYGLQAVTRMSRTYARGGGAVAGKLTVAGDPRGAAWVRATQQEFWRDLVKPRRSFAAVYRTPHFLRAYREVVAGYTIDPATGWLRPRPESRAFSDQRLQVGS